MSINTQADRPANGPMAAVHLLRLPFSPKGSWW
jgi:hypothetical protein